MRIYKISIFSLFLVFLFFTRFTSKAQTVIIGTVRDSIQKEGIPFVNVTVEGTGIGTSSDANGIFILKTKETSFFLLFTYISYSSKRIFINTDNKDTLFLKNVLLQEEEKHLQEVTVAGQRQTNTELASMLEIKKIEQIAVGVSQQQIGKAADRDAAQIMKRITGITLMNDKFLLVRGLHERYNTVLFNDAISPSAEVDTRSFAFDVIPSNVIDRILIIKSPSAELPGEVAGGIIKVYSRSVIDEEKTTLSLGTSIRSNVSFENSNAYKGSATDFLGFDNGYRSMNILNRDIINGNNRGAANELFIALNPYYNVNSTTILPDGRLNIGFQKNIKIQGITIANVSNVSYSHTSIMPFQAIQKRYEGISNDQLVQNWEDKNTSNTVKVGIISNFYTALKTDMKVHWKHFFTNTGIKETLLRTGSNTNDGIYYKNYGFRYEGKSIYTTQLAFAYPFNKKLFANATLSYNLTNREEPDYRRFSTSATSSSGNYKVDVPSTSNPSLTQGSRFWSALKENTGMMALNFEYIIKEDNANTFLKLKFGTLTEYKNRTFSARWFGYINPKNIPIESLSIDEFFSTEKLKEQNALSLYEGTNYDDAYTAQNTNISGYINLLFSLHKLFSTWGIRAEYNKQQLQSQYRGSGLPVEVNNPILSILPSIHLQYTIIPNHTIKTGYGISVNRPELRELAPFSYYDFELNIAKTGNPTLKVASIHNADIRYEYYPSKEDIISLGVFYKYFINPIEATGRSSGSGTAFYFTNPASASNAGIELEIKKNIRIHPSHNLQIVANASYIHSQVDASNLEGQISKRNLQGQSPYIINAGIYYEGKTLQCNLLYNIIGKRIFVVGDNLGNQTIYEMPRHNLDFTVSQTFHTRWEWKLSINDILNPPYQYLTDNNLVWRTYTKGSSASISIQYTF
ncbi:MAG: TonB-dependent receptor [Chitinophagaceae bacterium]|nr:TonB-dependent receptor [Chitinophagaceae bacterium]